MFTDYLISMLQIVVPTLPGKALKRQLPFRQDDGIFEDDFVEDRRQGLESFINKWVGSLKTNVTNLFLTLEFVLLDFHRFSTIFSPASDILVIPSKTKSLMVILGKKVSGFWSLRVSPQNRASAFLAFFFFLLWNDVQLQPGILPCCILNDLFTYGYEHLLDLCCLS